MRRKNEEESRLHGKAGGDIIRQAGLTALANKQAAVFHATADLSKELGRPGARLSSGAIVEPRLYTFDPGLVLVRTSAGSPERKDRQDPQRPA